MFINAYPESMESGKEYIVLVSALEPDIGESDEETVFYMQASPDGIIPAESEEAYEIYNIIE